MPFEVFGHISAVTEYRNRGHELDVRSRVPPHRRHLVEHDAFDGSADGVVGAAAMRAGAPLGTIVALR